MDEVPLYGGSYSVYLGRLAWQGGGNAAPIEREIFIGNLLVRIHSIIEMSRPALQ